MSESTSPLQSQSGDSSDKQSLAYQGMHEEMQKHQQALQNMRKQLEPINLRSISDKEVKRFNNDLDRLTRYIQDPANQTDIYQFIPSVDALKEPVEKIMINFIVALDLWDWFTASGTTMRDRAAGKKEYYEYLSSCREYFDEAIATFLIKLS